jgi:hypothetical protein
LNDEHQQIDINSTPKKALSKKAKQRLFLEAYAEHANVLLAARVAGVHRTTVYQWAEHDEEFAFSYNQAKEDAKDALRAEIYRRGVEGYEEDVYQLGKFAGTVRKYDTSLLIFHAKMMMPEYRDKQQIEHTGNITINTVWATGAIEEEQHGAVSS